MKDNKPVWLVVLALMALLGAPLAAQAPAAIANADRDAQTVRAWVQRWNALGSDDAKAIDELLALYEPDALHVTGPLPHQRGTATYRGHDGIRVLASRIAASRQALTYRIETETANEETAELLHLADGTVEGPVDRDPDRRRVHRSRRRQTLGGARRRVLSAGQRQDPPRPDLLRRRRKGRSRAPAEAPPARQLRGLSLGVARTFRSAMR